MPVVQLTKHMWMDRCDKAMEMRKIRREVDMADRYEEMEFSLYRREGTRWWRELQTLNTWGVPCTKWTTNGQRYNEMSSGRRGLGEIR